MKIIIGSDPFGYTLKEIIKKHLETTHKIEDIGGFSTKDKTPYFTIAHEAGKRISTQQAERAILVCSTGAGTAIVANKHPGVYAVACESLHAARYSRSINNANVLALGGQITPPEQAQEIIDVFLKTAFAESFEEADHNWLCYSLKYIEQLEKNVLFHLHPQEE